MINISMLTNKLWYAKSDYVAFVKKRGPGKPKAHKFEKWFFCVSSHEWVFNPYSI